MVSKALKDAFKEAAKLSVEEQEALAERIRTLLNTTWIKLTILSV